MLIRLSEEAAVSEGFFIFRSRFAEITILAPRALLFSFVSFYPSIYGSPHNQHKMARGDKTKAAGAAAVTSFGTAFFDPTGASAVTFLATGTSFAIGSTYHITRGSLKLIKEGMASNREKKAAANNFGIPPTVHVDMQETFENST